MKKVPDELVSFLKDYDNYLIVSHREPDGDCIGSSLALAAFLARHGKQTFLISAGPFKRPEIQMYEKLFLNRIPEILPRGKTALLIVDCSGLDRLGEASHGLESFPFAVLDHHATNNLTDGIGYIDSTSPSTTILVQLLIEAIDGMVMKEEASHLMFGLCTDTGFFRHLDAKSSETFECASRLVAAGANPKQTFAHMNGGKSWGSRIIISRILSRMKRFYNNQLVISFETIEDTSEFGMEGRDSDSLYQLIQSISGTEAIVIVRQETPDTCTVGFRSLDRIDVSKVAAVFGGGGHRQASGLSIAGTIDSLIPRFVAAFQDQFPDITP